jgi:Lrp/AsnC family transcriptional regulator, leucine-responsive regulatory protein
MDDKDRLLLTLLRRDARKPVVALARDLGLSRTATQDRLAKLQVSGAIASFTIVEGDGQARENAYLMIKLDRGVRCIQIAAKVRAIPAVEAIHSVTGAIDMIVCVAAEHVEGIETARDKLASLPGVAEVSTHVVLQHLVR